MPLPNLGGHTDGVTITEGSDLKEDLSNDLDALLDNAMNLSSDLNVAAGGTFNLNTPQVNLDLYLESGLIRLIGAAASAVTIIVPDGNKRVAFENVSGQAVTIDTVTGATPTASVPTGTAKILHIRGTEVTIVADDADATGALLADGSTPVTGDFDWVDNELKRALLVDYSEGFDAPVSAGTVDLSLEKGNTFEVTLAENTTLTFSDAPISGRAGSFTLIIKQDLTGGWTVTLPGTVIWEGGIAPIFSTAANSIDVVSFVTVDGGAAWFGFLGGLAFA